MSRNASGTYSRVTPPGASGYQSLTVIDPAIVNSEINDIGTEITFSIDKSGRTTPTANLPMGGFKHTGLAHGSAAGNSVAYEQLDFAGLVNGYVDWQVTVNTLIGRIKSNDGNNPSATNPVYIKFRNAALADGTFVVRSITGALSITASNGSKLGSVDAIASRIYLIGVDTGAGVVLGLYNPLLVSAGFLIQHNAINNNAVYSTTAEGGAGAADNALVIYTSAAQTSKPVALLGWFESTQTTAGTWAQAATAVHTIKQGSSKGGDSVRFLHEFRGGVDTTNLGIPEDDTIPQITEGKEFFSRTFASSSSANIIKITCKAMVSSDSANAVGMVAALFRNGLNDALCSDSLNSVSANTRDAFNLDFMGIIPAVSFIISLRMGTGAGTMTLNGHSAGIRLFGSNANSYLKIEEIFV